jgi:hypothetical protein
MSVPPRTLAAVLAALFWAGRVVATGDEIAFPNGDILLYFYPLYDTASRWIAEGRLPLWNPYQLCGIPWLATLQGGFLYPPHVLYLVLPTWLALATLSALHVVFIAASTVAFAQRAGFTATAAVAAAALYTLRGMIPHMVLFPNWLEAAAWLPLGCLAVLRIAAGGGTRPAALLAACAGASWLAGYPQITVFVLYAWGTLLVALLVGTRAGPRRWAGAAATFAAALGLGTLAAGAQLLPALELSLAGTRETQQLTLQQMFPMGSIRGNPFLGTLRQWLTGSQFSFGIVGLALLPAALLARRHRALVVWAAIAGLLSLAFALGPLTPLFDLYLRLPLMNWFRLPSRIAFVTDFCFAIAAGAGLDALARRRAPREPAPRRWWPPAVAALPAVCAAGLAARAVHLGAYGAASLGFVAAATAAAAAGAPGRRGPGAGTAATVLLGLAVSAAFLAPPKRLLLPFRPAVAAMYRGHEATYDWLARRLESQRAWILLPGFAPWEAPRLATRYRVRSVDDYEPVNLRRQAEYFGYFTQGSVGPVVPTWLFDGRIHRLDRRRPATRRRLLDLAAVRYVAVPVDAAARPEVTAFLRDADLRRLPSPAADVRLYENPHAVPRAFVTYRSLPAPPPAELLGRLADPAFDPLAASYVEGDPGFVPAPDAPERGAAAAVVLDAERVVELDVTLAAPGLVVLGDSIYPGWRATLDGAPVPIVAANHLFRAVSAPAGRHRVRFEYRPGTFLAGAAVSAAAVLAILALAAFGRRHTPG